VCAVWLQIILSLQSFLIPNVASFGAKKSQISESKLIRKTKISIFSFYSVDHDISNVSTIRNQKGFEILLKAAISFARYYEKILIIVHIASGSVFSRSTISISLFHCNCLSPISHTPSVSDTGIIAYLLPKKILIPPRERWTKSGIDFKRNTKKKKIQGV